MAKHVRSSLLRREHSATTTKLRVMRPLHHGSLATRAPVVPLPRFAGADSASAPVLATPSASEFCRPKPPVFCLQKNKGRRSAEKAHQSSVLCGARPRAERSALAFRRSTAALTEVSRPRLFDSRPGFLGRGSSRALPAISCPSPAAAPRAPAVIPVDMMPEAARERTANPPAGTAPAPRSGVPREHVPCERDCAGSHEKRMRVNMNVTARCGPSWAGENAYSCGFSRRANGWPAQGCRTVSWTGGQIAQLGALGEMKKVVEWQGLRRGERIFVMSADGNSRNKARRSAPA